MKVNLHRLSKLSSPGIIPLMLKIKLARFGKNKQPHYRVVINEAKDKRDGRYVESIGHYAPTMAPKILEIDLKKYAEWLTKGAQPTETVAGLVKRLESKDPFPARKAKLSKKAKAKQVAAKEAAAAEAAKPAEPKAPAEAATPEAATEAPVLEAAAPETANPETTPAAAV